MQTNVSSRLSRVFRWTLIDDSDIRYVCTNRWFSIHCHKNSCFRNTRVFAESKYFRSRLKKTVLALVLKEVGKTNLILKPILTYAKINM